MSRTLVPPTAFDNVSIHVMNTQSHPVTVRRGTQVATLEPTEVLEYVRDDASPGVIAAAEQTSRPDFVDKLLSVRHPSLPETAHSKLEDVHMFSAARNTILVSRISSRIVLIQEALDRSDSHFADIHLRTCKPSLSMLTTCWPRA